MLELLRNGSLVVALSVLVLPASADDWPQLRGPGLDNRASAEKLESAIAVDFEEIWRRPLGSGYSAVAVVGPKAVTAATRSGHDSIIAFEASSGETLWQFAVADVFQGSNGSDDGPSSTPTIGGGRVFLVHPSGRLVCVDLESGELLWQRHLVEDFGGRMPPYGYSTAPLLSGERLLVQAGGSEGRLLVALAPDTGRLLWSAGEEEVALEHQNPMAWSGPGGDQVVVVSPSAVAGYRLSDGAVLWTLELEGRGHAGDVTVVDDHRLIFHRHNEDSRLITVEEGSGQGDGDWAARVVWSTNHLDHSYAIPIVNEGHVYGFDGRFLVCLELASGELVWKSRPPGGGVVSLIGNQLMVVNDDGELVSVSADPEGYRETGRHPLFEERQVMTPVTYGAGLLYVRNLEEIVALRPSARGDTFGARARMERVPPAFLTRLLRELPAEAGPEGLEAALAERYPTSPVVEDGRAHFLWIGDQSDVAVVGDMTFFHEEVALERLLGTRVQWASFDAPRGERWEYVFKLYEEERLDPRNSLSIESLAGERSVAELPGYDAWQPPRCEGCPEGRVDSVEVPTQTPGRSFRMSVYLPASAESGGGGERRWPLAILTDGAGAQRLGQIPSMLNALIGSGEIEPVVVALLELPEAVWYSRSRAPLETILDQHLVPYLEENYPVSRKRSKRAVISQRDAVDNSLWWALRSGSVGLYATQSPAIVEHSPERLLEPLLAESPPLRLQVGRAHFDQKNPDYGLDVERQSDELIAISRRHGHEAEVRETLGGANWTSWREMIAEALLSFFPANAR